VRFFDVNLHCNLRDTDEPHLRLGNVNGQLLLCVAGHL